MNKEDAKELRRQEQRIGEMETLIVSADASANRMHRWQCVQS